MGFAEVLLRLGCALVAWMMLYTYFLWLAVLQAMGCGPDGDATHKLLLGLVPLACGAAAAIQLTAPLADVHRMLRWLAAPLVILLPFAIRSVWDVARAAHIDGVGVCGAARPEMWLMLWPAAQILACLLSCWMMARAWRLGDAAPERMD